MVKKYFNEKLLPQEKGWRTCVKCVRLGAPMAADLRDDKDIERQQSISYA